MNLAFESQHTANYSSAVGILRDKQVLARHCLGFSTGGREMSEVKMKRGLKVWRCPSQKNLENSIKKGRYRFRDPK